MKKIIYILLLLGITVQAQFTPVVGILASKSGGGGTPIDYSIANSTYSGLSYDPSAESGTNLEDAVMGGGKVFVYGDTFLWQYNISDTEDISTMSYSGTSADNSFVGQYRAGISIDGDGSAIMGSNFGATVSQFQMTTPYDISTYTNRVNTSLSGVTGSTNMRGWSASIDGTKIWGFDTTSSVIWEFDVSPAWTGTPVYSGNQIDLSAHFSNGYGMGVSPDGKYMVIGDSNTDELVEFTFGTVGVLSSLTFNVRLDVSGQDSVPYGIFYSEGSSAINMVGIQTDKIYQYDLNNTECVPNNIYTEADAAAPLTCETNSVGNWTYTTNNIISVSSDSYDGDYSLSIKNTAGGVATRREYDFTGVDGKTYQITIWAKSVSGSAANQGFVAWTGFTGFSNTYMNGATDWTKFTWTLTASGTAQKIRVYPSSDSGTAGLNDEVLIDRVSIVQLD